MKKNLFLRIVFYVAGLLILALGIILNTKSGLGVSPIISVAYSIATIGGFNFGNITFLLYSAFVVVEIVLHIFRNHRYYGEAGGAIAPAAHRDLKLVLVMDLLQLPQAWSIDLHCHTAAVLFYFIAHCTRHIAPICTNSITGTPIANLALRVLW